MEKSWPGVWDRELERLMFGAISGATTTTQAQEPPPALTVERLTAAMAKFAPLPPPPFLARCRMLPADYALSFEHGGRLHIGAHPDFWAKQPKQTGSHHDFDMNLPIIDIDLDAARSERAAFFGALVDVMRAGAAPLREPLSATFAQGVGGIITREPIV